MGSFLVKRHDGTEKTVMRYVQRGVVSRYHNATFSKEERRVSVSVERVSSPTSLAPEEDRISTLEWSPLPERRTINNLCVALFCDDAWTDTEFDPTPDATSTLRKRIKSPLDLSFDEEAAAAAPHDGDESPVPEGPCLRPYTNPRDTPTHQPSFPGPTLCTQDLKLDSLHDLEWLKRMEPQDQAVLQVHVIWSILTLMVVLLACYSLHHHSL